MAKNLHFEKLKRHHQKDTQDFQIRMVTGLAENGGEERQEATLK